MAEYESNMDFDDVFNFFTLNHSDSSLLSDIHSPPHYPEIHEPTPEVHDCKHEMATCDSKSTREGPPHADPPQPPKNKEEWLEFEGDVRARNEAVRVGSKNDTMELNINFKTIICAHFRELQKANELTAGQEQRLTLFASRSPSFKSLLLLTARGQDEDEEEGIGALCRKLVESAAVVRRILESKCRLRTKLHMVKFVEALRRNLRGDGSLTKWKARPSAR